MMDSKRITELNQRSVKLTDAELSMAQEFSVLLPMSDLPEIVITGDDGNPTNPSGDNADLGHEEVTTIPFKSREKVPSESEKSNPSDLKADREDINDELLASVELPQDELSISKTTAPNESAQDDSRDAEFDSGTEGESEEGDFRIEDVGPYSDRVEKIARSIESHAANANPSLIAITSATELHDQDTVFNSILVSIARRNPTLRLIGIQNCKPNGDSNPVSIGVGQVLSEEYLLEDVVIPTTVENLDYLAYSESELSTSTYRNRFLNIANELKKHYDLVFVNCGLWETAHANATAELADSLYLMVSLQVCEKESMEKAADSLRKSGARLTGCIVTEYQRDAS